MKENNIMKSKKAQVAEGLVWAVATVIIVLFLAITLVISNAMTEFLKLLGRDSGSLEFSRALNAVSVKSATNFLLTPLANSKERTFEYVEKNNKVPSLGKISPSLEEMNNPLLGLSLTLEISNDPPSETPFQAYLRLSKSFFTVRRGEI